MTEQDQRIAHDLVRPEGFPEKTGPATLVQTHISFVFIADEYVYKVKKAVDFGFLDFSSLEKRKRYCDAEVSLNRRLSPHVYLEVVPVTESDGRLVFGGEDEPVDWAVRMRRIPMERQMLKLIEAGSLAEPDVRRAAETIARFHREEPARPELATFGSLETVKFNTDENFEQTVGYIGRTITREQYDALKAYTDRFYRDRADLLARRISDGFVKDCHGDLHLEHIILTDPVTVFDCIEFNERFRYSDTAADIAFLAMELDFRGHPELTKVLMEAYVTASGDPEVMDMLTFYKVYRAYVRGKVISFRLDDPNIPEDEKQKATESASRYFKLAHSYITEAPV